MTTCDCQRFERALDADVPLRELQERLFSASVPHLLGLRKPLAKAKNELGVVGHLVASDKLRRDATNRKSGMTACNPWRFRSSLQGAAAIRSYPFFTRRRRR